MSPRTFICIAALTVGTVSVVRAADEPAGAQAVTSPSPERRGMLELLLGGEPSIGVDVGGAASLGDLSPELDVGPGVRVHLQTDVPLLRLLRLELGVGVERMARSAAGLDGALLRVPLYASAMLRAPRSWDWAVHPYARGGVGLSTAQLSGPRAEADFDQVLHAGAGLNFPLGRLWGDKTVEGRVDVTYNAQFQSRTGSFLLVSLGAQKALVFDADGDGLADDVDACDDLPEDKDGFRDDDGCPDEDNDADRVLDVDDGCPDAAEDFDGFDDGDGCAELDNDLDQIEDRADACRNEPEDRDDFLDTDGCPDLDNDADTLLDRADKCPNDAEDKDGFQDGDGCPEVDNDGDGIADLADACPLQPEDKNGLRDDDGCPDAKDDRDRDAIADSVDVCPTEPEDRDGYLDEDGCPELDNDSDGLNDNVDKCPLEPEDKDEVADEDGCFDDDYDHDGIGDQGDRCPLAAEVINGVEDGDGCPDEGATLVELKSERIEIKEKVHFKTDSNEIDSRSFGLLDQVAALLGNHRELLRVRVEGHTDDVGAEDYNLALSQRRADAVRAYLTARGVDAGRVVGLGVGEARPLAPNTSRVGRELNRRVEFLVEEEAAKAPPPVAPPPAPRSAPPAPSGALHQLAAPQSLEALSVALWKSPVHAKLLLEANPSAKTTAEVLASGTVVSIPRTTEYVVQKGDGLSDIAKKQLGRGKLHELITAASRDVLSDPSKLSVGMKLTIPLVHPDVEKKLRSPK